MLGTSRSIYSEFSVTSGEKIVINTTDPNEDWTVSEMANLNENLTGFRITMEILFWALSMRVFPQGLTEVGIISFPMNLGSTTPLG